MMRIKLTCQSCQADNYLYIGDSADIETQCKCGQIFRWKTNHKNGIQTDIYVGVGIKLDDTSIAT